LVHLQKSLEKDERKLLDLGKNRNNVHQEVFVWQAKCKDYNPIALEKHRAMATTTIANLKKREWDFELTTNVRKSRKVRKNMTSHGHK
jgi:hypothetical protein